MSFVTHISFLLHLLALVAGVFTNDSQICGYLKDDFRFDVALNVAWGAEDIYEGVDKIPDPQFRHYFLADRNVLRYKWSDAEDMMIVDHDAYMTALLANITDLSYDLAFNLVAKKSHRSYLCFIKFINDRINCVEVNHGATKKENNLQSSPLPGTFLHTDGTFRFRFMAGFRPTVAFQSGGFISSNLRDASMVIFIEQTLNNETDGKPQFRRRMQAYQFDTADTSSIMNVTQSIIPPSIVEHIPAELELTGIFSWGGKDDQYSIIAFNGTNHLECYNADCREATSYKVIDSLRTCRPKDVTWPITPAEQGRMLRLHYTRWIETGENTIGSIFEKITVDRNLWQEWMTVIANNLLIFLAIMCGILILAVFYYSLDETCAANQYEFEKGPAMAAMVLAERGEAGGPIDPVTFPLAADVYQRHPSESLIKRQPSIEEEELKSAYVSSENLEKEDSTSEESKSIEIEIVDKQSILFKAKSVAGAY